MTLRVGDLHEGEAEELVRLTGGRRWGRPLPSPPKERGAFTPAALSRPADLALPFACWTLDRLVAYLSGHGIAMRRSRISELFIHEGLKWRHEETWFGERVDPD